MKTFNNFITERAGGPASPGGKDRKNKQSAQNAANRRANMIKRDAKRQVGGDNRSADPWAGSSTVPKPKPKTRRPGPADSKKAPNVPKAPAPRGLGGRRQVGQARTRGIVDKTLQQRKSGFMGGLKSSLGGDVIGMRHRKGDTLKGDTLVMDKRREQMNKKSREEAGKKVGQAAKKELRDVFRLPKQKEVGVSQGGGLTGPKTRSSGGGAQ